MVRVEERDALVHFSIADTGIGIAREHLPRLFERFWQAQKSDRRGAGLGLTIVKGIAEAHAGRVWAEGELGKGSTFYFALPSGGQPKATA